MSDVHIEMHLSTGTGPPSQTTSRGLPVAIGLVGIMTAWWIWLTPTVTGQWPVGLDTFRDMAGAENILAGRWFVDPSMVDQPYWYAPLGSMIFAGISSVTGQPPLMVYSSSILWFNMLLPVGWFLLAVCCWRRALAGIAAVIFVGVGSRWWTTHMTMPMTSVQGVVLLMATLLLWHGSVDRSRRWVLLVGTMLALCTWVHIVSGMLAAGAIGLHAILGAKAVRQGTTNRNAELRRRMGIVALVCVALVGPLAWHMMTLSRINWTPIEYLANEMRDPAFGVQTHAALILGLGVIGFVNIWRRQRERAGWLTGYVLVALIGQGLGYVNMITEGHVPMVTPHEFQWHFQLGWGVLAAGGAIHLVQWSSARLARWVGGTGRKIAFELAMTGVIVPVSVAGSIQGFGDRSRSYWKTTELTACHQKAVDWIRENSSIDDVFLSSIPTNYLLIGGRTGRKMICPPKGHANIAVSATERILDRDRMYQTRDVMEFRRLLSKYGVAFVLLPEGNTGAARAWQGRWHAFGILEEVFRCEEDGVTILRVVGNQPAP